MNDHDQRSEQPDSPPAEAPAEAANKPANGAATTATTRQVPHVPGQNPYGTGLPRQRDAVLPTTSSRGEAKKKSPPPGEEDAPLGGSEVTEDQLTADTAVERDALKSLDPNDSPA